MLIRHLGVLCVLAACLTAGCKGGGNGNEANSPVGPSNSSKVQGGWTGTLTRPGGQVLQVRWDVGISSGSNGDELTGTVTLTGPSASTTAAARGLTGGNDKSGYNLHLQWSDMTPPAACSVKASSTTQSGDPYPSPYTTITASLQVFVNGDCRGIFDGATTPFANITETARLSLTK
jgi:hypothetical protein